ncbi:MAG: putative DNA binding domain-containing protein [Candidatus Aenigmarchaeota archaeon]|nr:putative DNA binding domain-containing protein [Candidatus Aenigmarchaeota archaeon]
MYLKDDLLELISFGESVNLEFKESLSKELRKEIKYSICAFANTLGGKILVGVDDSGEIIGVDYDNSILAQVQHFAREINPNLKIHVSVCDELYVIIIEVFKSDDLHNINGMFFIRERNMTQKLISPEEIRSLFELKNKLSFDDKINADFDLVIDFNNDIFQKFLKRTNIPLNIDKQHLLNNLGLLKHGKLTNAGVLFFCRDISTFLSRADIVCVLWKGKKSRVDIIDSQEFNADFVSNYENSFKYIVSKLNTYMIPKPMGRDDILELPEDALREAILNAMIHRDYFSKGRIQIDIYLDRVEISNPGGLLFDEKELGLISLARNHLIVDMAFRLNLVEKLGSGINKIKDLCGKLELPVDFNISHDWFTVIFYRRLQDGSFSVNIPETTQKTTQKILELLKENPNYSRKELANLIGNITEDGIKYHLEKLKSEGRLKRIGPDKGGHWEVLK